MKTNAMPFLVACLFGLSAVFINCAGSRQNGDEADFETDTSVQTEQKKQQDDLDDIEALLGIKTDESQQRTTTQAKKSDAEQLELLNTNEFAQQQTAKESVTTTTASAGLSQQEKKEYENKIKNLENQLRQKEATIQDLNSKLTLQEAEMKKTTVKQKKSEAVGAIGEVAVSDYQLSYDAARAAFEERNYQFALQNFEALLASSASHSLSDNAQFWIGECHFALKQYDAAIIAFEKVFAFTNSNKKPDAQFKLGICYFRKGDTAKAVEEWDRLRANFPNSELNARVEKILAKR